uniref:Uncharacterized protein n=1 Tax=Cohnella candidum TaxID=2674991 RepID=A0A3G3JT25_9BACL|nr:hypothetical protein EAV92_01350 [Cohnella candidum]
MLSMIPIWKANDNVRAPVFIKSPLRVSILGTSAVFRIPIHQKRAPEIHCNAATAYCEKKKGWHIRWP